MTALLKIAASFTRRCVVAGNASVRSRRNCDAISCIPACFHSIVNGHLLVCTVTHMVLLHICTQWLIKIGKLGLVKLLMSQLPENSRSHQTYLILYSFELTTELLAMIK